MRTVDLDSPEYARAEDIFLVDEHVMFDENGEVEANIDHAFLNDMAHAGNERVATTGDAVPAIIGHTTDDANDPQKPVKGWFRHFKVLPFFDTGRYALAAQFVYKPKDKEYLEEFPRRSVEAWIRRRQVDPVALLGGTTPDRDLGPWRLSRQGTPERPYQLEYPMTLPATTRAAPSANGTAAPPKVTPYRRPAPVAALPKTAPVRKGMPKEAPAKMAKDDDDETVDETVSETADETPPTPDAEGGDDVGAKYADLFASAQWQEMVQQTAEILDAIRQLGGDEADPDMDADAGDLPPDDGGMGGDLPPDNDLTPVEGESAFEQEGTGPVRFDEAGGMGDGSGLGQSGYEYSGSTNSQIPNTLGKRKTMSRPTTAPVPTKPTPASPPSRAVQPARSNDPEVVRLRRQVDVLTADKQKTDGEKYAVETIRRLQRDHSVRIEDEKDEVDLLQNIYLSTGKEGVDQYAEKVMVKRYARLDSDPTFGVNGDLRRMSRQPDAGAAAPTQQQVAQWAAEAARRNVPWAVILAEKNGQTPPPTK